VKDKLVIILVLLLAFAFMAEATVGLWGKSNVAVELLGNEDKGKSKETESEKEDTKDKISHSAAFFINTRNKQVLFFTANTFFKYSAYLSLPEIPPDLA
jgi:uncharacterized protein YxeA